MSVFPEMRTKKDECISGDGDKMGECISGDEDK